MVYKFRPGHSAKVSADVIGEQLEQLAALDQDGVVKPKSVVEAARPANAPLHPCFEWANKEAAERWREHQARQIIRSIEVVIDDNPEEDGPQTEIAFVSIATSRKGEAGYIAASEIKGNLTLTEKVVGDAMAQLRAWRRRYGKISALKPVVEAIEELDGAVV